MKIGEPTDVKEAKSWDDLTPDRYLISKSEAKAGKVTSAEKNYAIALEKELMGMNTLLSKVTDKELDTYDSEKMKKYVSALENFSKNEKISDTEGTLINDTFYVNLAPRIAEIKEKYKDKLTEQEKDQLDKTEENLGNNSQNDYNQWLEDQRSDTSDSSDADIWDGGEEEYNESGIGILVDPLFDFVLLIGDAVNATLQKIMLADESDNGLLANIKEVIGDTFDIMSEDSADAEFETGGAGNSTISVRILQKFVSLEFPHIHYSCEEIFSGKVSLLNINFVTGDGQSESLGTIRTIISSWYKTLRLMAIIGMLSILIYTGIRTMLSSTSQEKAKYKEWVINWIIGMILLFSLHYIMSFITTIIDKFNQMLSMSMQYFNVSYQVDKFLVINDKKGTFSTNLIGMVRFLTQSSVPLFKMGYLILYVMLTTYTIKFSIIYLKRLINMAFLTLIAPLIAFTYPIDKMADGQAQGFNIWIKEYVYNALLQPMHFILYYSLVGASIKISATNPLYAIAVLSFMTEGERLLKKIFGFDKANGFGIVKGMQDAVIGTAIASKLTGLLGKGGGNADAGKMIAPKPTNDDFKDARIDMGSSEEPLTPGPVNGGGGNPQPGGNPQHQQSSPHRRVGPPVITGIDTSAPKINTPIHELAKKIDRNPAGHVAMNLAKTKAGRGARSVGRRIIRPVWDTQKDAKWNGKRLVRNLAKGAVGTAVGLTAAAVQAGISLTDGHYNIAEGLTSFGAGFGLAGRMTDGLVNTYKEGVYEALTKEEKMKRYQENFRNRDDVIKFCQENYGDDWVEYRDRMTNNFVTRGCTDLNEMKEMMKYSNKMTGDLKKRTDLTDEEKFKMQEEQDATALILKTYQKQKAKEGTLNSVYNLDAENEEILAKTSGMGSDDAKKTTKEIRDRNAAIRWYNDHIK